MRLPTTLWNRKLVQWAIAYAAAAWAFLQLLDFLVTQFHWSSRIVPAATVFLAIGLAAALVIAWYHGEQGRQRVAALEVILLALILIAAVAASVSTLGRAPRAAAGQAPPNSVAVLPFVNVSRDPANEYYSDGITEEILNALSRVQGLNVAARTSSFAFKGKDTDVREIAAQLGVRHVLEGSVQRVGSRIRISAQLINALTGYDLWSERFDRESTDLFAIEDEISRAIVQELEVRLGADSVLVTTATPNMGAHDLYLLGLDRFRRRHNLKQGVQYFEQAIAADSGYADAYAGLALVYSVLQNYDESLNQKATLARGSAAARKALVLDPQSAQAHAALTQIALFQDSSASAIMHAREAIRLNPNYATAHQWLAEALEYQGQLESALASSERAVQLDPLSSVINYINGRVLSTLGRYDAALVAYGKAIALDSASSGAARNIAMVALAAKQYDVARARLPIAFRMAQLPTAAAVTIVDGLAGRAPKEELLLALRQVAAAKTAPARYWATVGYELAGQREAALAAARTEAADSTLNWGLITAVATPALKSLRQDPRFPQRLHWPR